MDVLDRSRRMWRARFTAFARVADEPLSHPRPQRPRDRPRSLGGLDGPLHPEYAPKVESLPGQLGDDAARDPEREIANLALSTGPHSATFYSMTLSPQKTEIVRTRIDARIAEKARKRIWQLRLDGWADYI